MEKTKYLIIFIMFFLFNLNDVYAYDVVYDSNYDGVADNQIQMFNLDINKAELTQTSDNSCNGLESGSVGFKKVRHTYYSPDDYKENGAFYKERDKKLTYAGTYSNDIMLVYDKQLSKHEARDVGCFRLKWKNGAYTQEGTKLDVQITMGVRLSNDEDRNTTKPIEILTTNNGSLWFNIRAAMQDGDGPVWSDATNQYVSSLIKISAKYDVNFQFLIAGTNTPIQRKIIPFHFTDLDQPDRKNGGYCNGDCEKSSSPAMEYTEGIKLNNNSGAMNQLYFYNDTTLKISENNTRFTATQGASSPEDMNKAGFFAKFNASNFGFTWTGSSCATGMGFIRETSFGNPDYSLDAACLGCDGKYQTQKNEANKAFIIQDTTDWSGILVSDVINTCNKDLGGTLHTYFKKSDIESNKIFCREEYHVYYPNKNNNVELKLGRYFTLNASSNQLYTIDSSAPNFSPIEVIKIRQCIGGDENNLRNFDKKSKETFKSCGGSISVSYNTSYDDYEEDKNNYTYRGELKSELSDSTSQIKTYTFPTMATTPMLEQRAVFSFSLKDNVYRYIRISDGLSVIGAIQDDISKGIYNDVGVSNFPIKLSASKDPRVRFSYLLPNASNSCVDSYSKMNKALANDKVLSCTDNKYNVYSGSNYKGYENIDDSACAKLFKKNTERYNLCVEARQNNKLGNCLNLINSNYYCDFKIDRCNKNSAGKNEYKNYVWSNLDNRCCKKDEYDSSTGKCADICDKSNYTLLGRDWNPETEECCPGDYKYNVTTKKCVPSNEKCDSKHLNCEAAGRPCCIDSNGYNYCGYYVNGKEVCPGRSNFIDYVYRLIDTKDSFIAQNGFVRDTGSNWCSNSVFGSEQFTCQGRPDLNHVIKNVITDKKISYDDAMYIVKLDASTINKIRQYNKNKSYEDFNLSCKKDGSACQSDFLRSTISSNVSGRCSASTKATFYKC